MKKDTAVLTLVLIIGTLLVQESQSIPGKWESIAVQQGETYDFSKVGWYPKNRRKMIFAIQACKNAILTLRTHSDDSYTMMYFGYNDNKYTVVIPSSDCDSTGNCGINHYKAGTYLNCSKPMFFWAMWDAAGSFQVGAGYKMGQNIIITLSGNGIKEEAAYMTLMINDESGGQMHLYVDDKPVFEDPSPDGTTEITIQETSVTGNILYTVTATDPEGDNVTASILEDADIFEFNGNDLTNIKPLDYESDCMFVLTISITDNMLFVNTTLTIRLENVFDEAPNVDATTMTIPEELEVGSFLDGGYTVSDIEDGDKLTYALTGTHASYFEITTDGRLKIASRIDFDPPNSITKLDQLTLTVTDLGTNTNSTTLVFTVTDVNDNKPTFSKSLYTAEVKEGAGTASLFQLTINDDDSGDNSDHNVTIDGDNPLNPIFTLNPSTLALSVDANKLDYEGLEAENFVKKLTFVATDKSTKFQTLSGTANAIIKILPVNEHTPSWTKAPSDQTVSEATTTGTKLGQYTAIDDDLSKDGDVTYDVVDVKDDKAVQRLKLFLIDSGTGDFFLASPLDYDTATGGAAYHDVTIKAVDGGTSPKSVETTFRITVTPENDNPPVFNDTLYQTVVAEDVSINSVILSVAASDADGDVLTYTIVGEGKGIFDYTTDLILLKVLDYEEQRRYTFSLKASDGVHETVVPISINVSNVLDETPVLTVTSPLNLNEELPVGTPLGGVYDVTDKDDDDTLSYSLEGTESSYFSIDSTTGLITVAKRIDRDASLTSLSQVTLKVTDAGNNTASKALSFTITDINDNSPQFSSDVIYVNLTENTVADTLLTSFNVTDADDGVNANVVVSILSGDDPNPAEKFKMDGVDLKTRATPVDYESLGDVKFIYTLSIQAVDQSTSEAAKTAIAVVVVTVQPVNEYTPVWTVMPHDGTLSESFKAGTVAAQFSAIDADLGPDGDVTYAIAKVSDDTDTLVPFPFILDSGLAYFIVISPLDYDKPTGGVAFYDVTINATDGGTAPNVLQKTFRISLAPANDNPPVFNDTLYQTVVAEDVSINSVILSVTATDVDGDALMYTIMGEEEGIFDYTTGLINQKSLDYEDNRYYTFHLNASDGVHSTTVAVCINVTNVIDENPVISVISPYKLNEELPVGTPLGGVYDVMDKDEDDTLSYSLEGTESSYFHINSATGMISIAKRIDREAGLSSISQVTLNVTDSQGNTASEPLSFTIVDVNDNSPQFSSDVIYVNVTENTPADQVLLTLTCTDDDVGNNAMTKITIKSGDATPARFKLNRKDLRTTSQAVNYEDPDVPGNLYSLSVLATDSPITESPKTAIATVIVMVLPENEFRPNFTNPVSAGVSLPETTKSGHLVETFIATDDDDGDDGRVVYEIRSVRDPSGASAISKFLIDELSGKLRVAEALDVDVATGGVAYYDINVMATDKGSLYKAVTIDFKVTLQNENDNAPVFVDFPSIVNVPENTNIGDVIMTLTTQDDDGDTVNATLDMTLFSVNGSDIKLKKDLDYETAACHTVVISISDGGFTVNKTLVVRVTDVIDEPPTLETFIPVNVTEELPVGTEIDGLYHVTDLDRNDSFTFTLTGSHSSFFSINSTSGQIKIARRIDLEALPGQNILDQLSLTVNDKAGLQATANLSVQILDINDAYPTFTQSVYKVNISESTPAEVLQELVCTDADTGTNGATSMQITNGDDPASGKFQLNGTQLSTLGGDLDYESLEATQYMYILTVVCTDTPEKETPKTGVTLVVVSVLPVNEHAPVWAPTLSVSGGALPELSVFENVTVGSDIITLEATDADHGADGNVSYNISSVTTNTGASVPELFSVDATSGMLRIARSLDRDITTGNMFYNLVLSAQDGGYPPKETTATLKITLENVNDNVPSFQSSDYMVEVAETTTVGTVIHTFAEATDSDGDTITYSIADGASSFFGITGLNLETLVAFDFERERCYSVVIEASDGLHAVNITMTVTVKDVIDEKPVIAAINPLVIPEEIPIGTRIYWAVNVTDEDKGDVLQYSMTGTDASYFSLNSDTGELITAQRLDRETKATFDNITIRIEDTGGLHDDVILTIDLVDINDVSPVFDEDVHVIYVTEGGGEVDLVTLVVNDLDTGDNANYDVNITSGNEGGQFRLEGMILKGDTSLMDYDSTPASNYTYIITIEAVDKPTDGVSRTGETVIIVHIGPLNEFTPIWGSPTPVAGAFPDVNVSESTAGMTKSLVIYNASDDDSGEHGQITYSIVSAATAVGKDATGVFLINPVDGTLWMTKEPDADAASGGTSSYDITIKAEDGGLKSIQAKQTVHVTNINDNPPTVWTSTYSEDVAESVSIGAAIFTLNVTDIDGDVVTPTIRQGGEYFHFDGTLVSIKKALDFETQECHIINISFSDGIHDVTVTLTVNVTDVSDNSPEVTVHSPVVIPEELPVGTILGGVYSVKDRDERDVLSYSLSGVDGQFLEINNATGELKVKARIDRDGVAGVDILDNLTLTVTDLAGNIKMVSFNISVLDINDNPPVCTQTVYMINVTENSTDGLVAQLNCTDEDAGDNGVFGVSITGGNDLGHINLTNMDVHATASIIDYESLDMSTPYTVFLSVTDQPTTEAAKTADISLIIKVLPKNEYSPEWQSPLNVTVALSETTQAGTVVSIANATDMDSGADGEITYDIFSIADEKGKDGSSLFMIEKSTGIVRTIGVIDRDPPDGMTNIEIIIKASDGGTVSKTTTGTLVIDVTAENDNPPVFTDMPTEVDILENSATGTVILNLQASDIDGDSVDFEISGNEVHMFHIVGSSLQLYQQLNYEAKQCHVLIVTAKDGVHATNISVTVNVLNAIDESPEITLNSPLEIPEELPVGMAIGGLFSVSDKDEGDNLTYTLTGKSAHYFHLNTSGELLIAKRIDRDSPGDVTFIDGLALTVTDSAGLKVDVNLTFAVTDINDNLPVCVIATSMVNVTENSVQDVVLSNISCTDLDDGRYGTVAVTLDASSDPNGHFKLFGTQLETDVNPVDYESTTGTEHIIKILAEDNPGGTIQLTVTTMITIKVLPVNEHVPVFTSPSVDVSGNFSHMTLLENVTVGTILTTFSAADNDSGADGDVIFSIASVTTDTGIYTPGIFSISSGTGDLTVTGELDADSITGSVSFYTVNITAEDSGSAPLSTWGTMRVLVLGINDNPPQWNITLRVLEVYENVSVGDVIFSLAAYDVDSDNVTFTSSDTSFVIDGQNLKIKQPLDFEQQRFHTLLLSASDGLYTVNQTLTIQVLDSNDESPIFTTMMRMTVQEEVPVGTALARGYIVTDMDESDELKYSLEGTDSSLLAINNSTGVITVQQRVDFESLRNTRSLDISVRVNDSAGHTVVHPLNLTVSDINDNTPVFSTAVNIITVMENASSEMVVLTLTCTDADSGNNGNFTFNISDGNSAGLFRLVGDDLYGSILDYEASQSLGFMYSLTISAVDHGYKPKTAVTVVVVEITPVNEFSPEWEFPTIDGNGRFPDLTLSESVLPGYNIITVKAMDQDLGEDGYVIYSIEAIKSDTGASGDTMFVISPLTGVLSTSSLMDFDQSTGGVNHYDITVRVTDKGNQSRSTVAIQRVILKNYNDITPAFTKTSFRANVGCHDPIGTILTKLSAEDEDGPTMEYGTALGSNPYVTVDNSGNVVLQAKPSGSSVTDLAQSVSVVASDKGTPELKGFSRLLVLFENCENATICANVSTQPTPTATVVVPDANCTVKEPCECNNTTTSCWSWSLEGAIEAWAIRILCMILAAALLGVTIMYFRPRSHEQQAPKKEFRKENTLERGVSLDSEKLFHDLEQHILHR